MINRAFLLVILLGTGFAQAQQYRSVDDKGRVQFSDRPPSSAAKQAEKKGIAAEPPGEGQQQEPFALQQARKDFPVTLYTAPICKQPCELARGALNRRGIPFTEVQVWNVETLEQLKALAGSDNVPALVVGRSALSGFEQGRFDGLLDSAGYPKAGELPPGSQAAPPPPDGYQPPPTAEPLPQAAESPVKPGPYDTSGLPSNRSDKPGPYDTSKLPSNQRKPGPYMAPGSTQ